MEEQEQEQHVCQPCSRRVYFNVVPIAPYKYPSVPTKVLHLSTLSLLLVDFKNMMKNLNDMVNKKRFGYSFGSSFLRRMADSGDEKHNGAWKRTTCNDTRADLLKYHDEFFKVVENRVYQETYDAFLELLQLVYDNDSWEVHIYTDGVTDNFFRF
jgi:hypothetical protein